jgi:hypothetical protein
MPVACPTSCGGFLKAWTGFRVYGLSISAGSPVCPICTIKMGGTSINPIQFEDVFSNVHIFHDKINQFFVILP